MSEKVCVVMSTYNGEKYLEEQIESILHQKDVEVCIFVRDDGSKDSTVSVLKKYTPNYLSYEEGDNCGAKNSFLKALYAAPDADYYAFADQDDVWDEDKLSLAICKIKEAEENNIGECILYCGRTRLVDAELNLINTKVSSKKSKKTINGFLRGQTRQSAGCTMVLNRNLKELASSYMPSIFPMHDAWLNNLCLAVGGIVIYDPVPHMNYRQHGNNVVGGKRGFVASVKRRLAFYKKMGKCYHTRMLEEIYRNYKKEMPIENIERYNFIASYKGNLKKKYNCCAIKNFSRGIENTSLKHIFLCYSICIKNELRQLLMRNAS